MHKHYFAVDLGATSGRTILGHFNNEGDIVMEELNRFPNHLIRCGNHFYWDLLELYRNVLEGLKIAAGKGVEIASIGIDTWGVDFVLLGKDGNMLRLPFSYRDPHTAGAPDELFKRMPRAEVYDRTGIQIMDFNSLFQLDAMRRAADSALEAADKVLFVPDALVYFLTGEAVTEYTIATTGQIIDAAKRTVDADLLGLVGLSADKFGRMVYPGEVIGTLSEEVQALTGLGAVPVVAVGEHDTASAVAAVPAASRNFAYLSSGTWSLMGVETDAPVIDERTSALNVTNEGGVYGTIRLLKNICGMWLLERCRLNWKDADYGQLIAEADQAEPFRSLINPNSPCFANPADMEAAIKQYCKEAGQPVPETRGQVVRCIFESLALCYRFTLDNLRPLADHPIDVLHIIGGGSRNALLNQFTANAIGIPVVAGPVEATALGNMMVQAIAAGEAETIADLRASMSKSSSLQRFQPEDQPTWAAAYDKYLKVASK